MRPLFITLSPEAKLAFITERRARRNYRAPKAAKLPRLTIASLSKAWGIKPTRLAELLTARQANAKVVE